MDDLDKTKILALMRTHQLMLESLAELVAGNPTVARSFIRTMQEGRYQLSLLGAAPMPNQDPDLELLLNLAASREQNARLGHEGR